MLPPCYVAHSRQSLTPAPAHCCPLQQTGGELNCTSTECIDQLARFQRAQFITDFLFGFLLTFKIVIIPISLCLVLAVMHMCIRTIKSSARRADDEPVGGAGTRRRIDPWMHSLKHTVNSIRLSWIAGIGGGGEGVARPFAGTRSRRVVVKSPAPYAALIGNTGPSVVAASDACTTAEGACLVEASSLTLGCIASEMSCRKHHICLSFTSSRIQWIVCFEVSLFPHI